MKITCYSDYDNGAENLHMRAGETYEVDLIQFTFLMADSPLSFTAPKPKAEPKAKQARSRRRTAPKKPPVDKSA